MSESSEQTDPYLSHRLKQAKAHQVIARIESDQLPLGNTESNKDVIKNPILEGTVEDIGWSKKSVDNIIDAVTNGRINVRMSEDGRLQIELLPLNQLPIQLGHVTENDKFRQNIERAVVFGSDDPEQPTYLQTVDFAVEGYMDDESDGKKYARIYVDSELLEEYRSIYLDPESLYETDYEYGHAFCVYGGIPLDTIDHVDIIRAKQIPYSISSEGLESSSMEEVEEDMAAQANRLNEFIKARQ